MSEQRSEDTLLARFMRGEVTAIDSKDLDELLLTVRELRSERDKLRAALTISRGQWIHSVNAKQCLEALGEIRG